jgi:hypothetical protein
MTTPIRIQRSRAKGSRLVSPNGLPIICVSRGTRLGNPFIVGQPCGIFADSGEVLIPALSREQCVEFYLNLADGHLIPEMYPTGHDFMRRWRERIKGMSIAEYVRVHHRGHNVACWCGIDDLCHGDVLLTLANSAAP